MPPRASRSGDVQEAVLKTMRAYVTRITAQAVLDLTMRRLGLTTAALERDGLSAEFIQQLVRGLSIYLKSAEDRRVCRQALEGIGRGAASAASTSSRSQPSEETIAVEREADVVSVRRKARELARTLGFDHTTQIKIATSVSELARNIYSYAGEGIITLRRLSRNGGGIEVVAKDEGPGIPNLQKILDGDYRSKTGMGLGLRGCRQLMDQFDIKTRPGKGTQIWMVKCLRT